MLRLFTLVIVATAFIYAIESDSLKLNTRDSIGKTCKPVNCKGKIKNCPYGYQKQHGCEICKCYDPCNPPGKAMLCGADEQCFIDKTAYGTFITRCDSIRSKRNKEACEQEQVVGLCKAAFPRFYYNLTMEKCEPFIYGGCGGNDNNFKTKDECETTCMA